MNISGRHASGILDLTLLGTLAFSFVWYFMPGNPLLEYLSYPPMAQKSWGKFVVVVPQKAEFIRWMGIAFAVLAGGSFLSGIMDRRIVYLGLSCLLVFLYYRVESLPLGDTSQWIQHADRKRVFLSEPLTNMVYYYMKRLGMLGRVGGLIGFLNALLFFLVADRLSAGARAAKDVRFRAVMIALAYVGSGVHLYYFAGTVENTYMSTPFLLGFLYYYAKYWHEDPGTGSRGVLDRNMALASLFLSLAALFHGQNTFLYPALPMVAAWRYWRHTSARRVATDLAVSHAVILVTAAACYLALVALGFEIAPGNVTGGGDESLFVPMGGKTNPFQQYVFFSTEHFGHVAGILSLASPLFFAVPVLALAGVRQAGKGGILNTALVVPALGYISFIILWNFDYGFPADYDLMVSMGVTVNLCLLSAFFRMQGRLLYLVCALTLVGALPTWYLFLSFTG
jgi:hypothetical protein